MLDYISFDPEEHEQAFAEGRLFQVVSEQTEDKKAWIEKLDPVESEEEFEAACRVPMYFVVGVENRGGPSSAKGKQAGPQARMSAQVEDLLTRAQDEVLIALQYDEDIDWEMMADRWAASLQSPLVELLRMGLQRSELAISFDQINEVARIWAREHAFALVNLEGASSVIRVIRDKIDRIREELETGVLGWLELEERLAPIFGDVRAHGIAETEITNAFTESGRLGARELGLGEKRSLTANDPLVCKICAANEEEGWMPIDAEYPHSFSGWVDGQGPAFHKGCRCMEAYR